MSAIQVVQEGYARYARRDFAGVFALLSPDIRLEQTPVLPWGGVYEGHEGARNFFTSLSEYTEAIPEPEQYFEAGDDVVVTGRLRGKVQGNGKAIDIPIVHIWTVKEGRITQFRAFIDTPLMVQALRSG